MPPIPPDHEAGRDRLLRGLTTTALLLALAVVLLGAYVRLSDAGLGCPDWPGCYGQALVPAQTALYPERPLEPAKAWKEMAHRYAAGTLGLLILALFVLGRRGPPAHRRVGALLLALVTAQALLGMWTVTLKLHPLVVLGHLLGGLAIVALLAWLWLARRPESPSAPPALVRLAWLGLGVVVLQIALGGWTSANYAAPYCPDFPTCQGRWWPEMDFAAALAPPPPAASGYEGGTLHSAARTAVHVAHRIGAVLTLLVLGALAVALWRSGGARRRLGVLAAGAVLAQFALGVANVHAHFPLALAVAHNGGAVLLLLVLVVAVRRLPVARWVGAGRSGLLFAQGDGR